MMKLDVKSFALTWWIFAFDGATGERTLIGQPYRGYSISPSAGIIGLTHHRHDLGMLRQLGRWRGVRMALQRHCVTGPG